MERRKQRIGKAVAIPKADSPNSLSVKTRDKSRVETQQSSSSPTIEISDADYRTLHMPCDALEDSGDSKPGN